MKQLYTTITLIAITISLNAQWSQLTDPHLSSVEYNGIVYTGSAVLLATDGGVFRSEDEGLSWELAVNGFPPHDLEAKQIAYIASRNEVWINVNSYLLKSTNHGLSWQVFNDHASGDLPDHGYTIALSRIGERLIVLHNRYDNDAGEDVIDLFYSDDGTLWTKGVRLGLQGDGWWDMLRTENNNFSIIFEETISEGEMEVALLYTENGIDLQELTLEGLGSDPRLRTWNVTADPEGTILLFSDQNNSRVMVYDIQEEEWTDRTNELDDPEAEMFMIFNLQSLGDITFASGMWAIDFGAGDIELRIYTSEDKGESWTRVAEPGLDMPMLSNRFIRTSSGRLVTEYFHSSIVISDNNGQLWEDTEPVPGGYISSLASLDDGTLFTVSEVPYIGLLISEDNGDTWSEVEDDLPRFLGNSFLHAVFADGGTLYATAQISPFDESLRLFISENRGVNWTEVENTPEELEHIELLCRHGESLIFYFMTEDDDEYIMRTADGGETWTDMSAAIFGTDDVDQFLGIKSNGALLIMFGRDTQGAVHPYISYNNGGSYSKIPGNLHDQGRDILIANEWSWDAVASAVADFSEDGESFYMGVYEWGEDPTGVRFYRLNSTFDGWEPAHDDILTMPPHLRHHSLKEVDGVWYYFFPFGVGVTADDFQTKLLLWENEGYQSGINHSHVVVNDYGVFTGTRGTGIWRAPITPPDFTTLPPYEITDTSAMAGAGITSTGGLPYTAIGLVWATTPNPTLDDNVLYRDPPIWYSFTDTMKILQPSTNYYARAFIQSPRGTFYGNQITFTTDQTTNIVTEEDLAVTIYPNPADGVFYINSDREYNVVIMNVIGKVVYDGRISEGVNTVNLTGQPPGIYLIRLTGRSGEVRMTRLILR